jgi:hypothetical protein
MQHTFTGEGLLYLSTRACCNTFLFSSALHLHSLLRLLQKTQHSQKTRPAAGMTCRRPDGGGDWRRLWMRAWALATTG